MEIETQGKGHTGSYRLVVLGDGSVRTLTLTGKRWVIGRSPDCEISLRDPTVSRRHVLLERHQDGFHLKDLGGRNPVLVDGMPCKGAVLTSGQSISIGMTRLVIESRHRPHHIEASNETVVITGREVIDDEMTEEEGDTTTLRAQNILERIEWTFADLGSLDEAAEPLLTLALNLTQHRRGMIGQFLHTGGLETLAALDTLDRSRRFVVPETLLRETRRLNQVSVLTTGQAEDSRSRLVIPLGDTPDAVLVLEDPGEGAPAGQLLLRLAKTLGKVIWHRLHEVGERMRLRDEVELLRFHGSSAHNAVLTSTRLQGARQHLRELANDAGAVLLVGEEGTEGEDLARYLHAEGSRRQHLFLSIHLGLLPEWRIARELFGDDSRTGGAAARARGGTLFLDNITLLSPPLQERLLAALRADEPGGLPPTRLVASSPTATDLDDESWHRPLAEELSTHVVTVPPLRDEPGDILAFAELFLTDMGSAPDGSPRLLSERTKRILTGYHWPGNVRQLRLVLETAAAQAGSQQITPKHLPTEIGEASTQAEDGTVASLEEVERRHIRDVLKRLGGNRARTAQTLGIASSTLYQKLHRYGIDG